MEWPQVILLNEFPSQIWRVSLEAKDFSEHIKEIQEQVQDKQQEANAKYKDVNEHCCQQECGKADFVMLYQHFWCATAISKLSTFENYP